MKHEDYVTYEQAMKLKDLGFDWKCNYYYEGNGNHPTLHESTQFYMRSASPYVSEFYHNFNDPTNKHGQPVNPQCSAPTISQAQKWLREVKETEVIVNFINEGIYNYIIYGKYVNINSKTHFNYEQALSIGINAALELLKE